MILTVYLSFLFLLLLSPVRPQPANYLLPPSTCETMFGKFCIRCIMTTCLQCKTDNFTLLQYKSNACNCQDPYLFNLEVSNRTNITTQLQFISQNSPCILCTDKFSLEICTPALFSKRSSKLINTTRISLGFNRDITVLDKFLPMEVLNKSLELRIEKDNSQIKIDYIEIQLPINRIGGSFAYSIILNVQNLQEKVKEHYIENQYIPEPYFVVKVCLKIPVLVNGTGLPLPQSFQTQLGFKSRGGFEEDQQYNFLYNGSQWLRYFFQMPPYNSRVIQVNSTKNEFNITDLVEEDNNIRFSNNLEIYHIFNDEEKKIKIGVQVGLIIANSFGFAGAGPTSWMLSSICFTQIFKNEGFYTNQTNLIQQNFTNRLLLFEDLPNMTFQFSNLQLLDCINEISNLTLLLNPLLLVEPYPHEVYLIPNFTIPFALTIFMLIFTLILILTVLCYANRYAISKRYYHHSHLLKTLSDKRLIVRSFYLSLRCLYPIFFYVVSIFIKQTMADNFGMLRKISWDLFIGIYLAEIAFMGIVIVVLPFFGIFFFSSRDKDNLYIFWRLYGEEAKPKQHSKDDTESSKDSQESQESSQKDQSSCSQTDGEKSEIERIEEAEKIWQNRQEAEKQIKSSIKKLNSSIKPKIYLLFDYLVIISVISICIWIKSSVNLRNNLLIAINAFFLGLSFYMYVTAGVSKIFAVIKIVDVSLNLIPAVCKLFWNQNIIAAKVGYYSFIAIIVWDLALILFSFFSILYWQVKGLGVYTYFLQKVVPIQGQQKQQKQRTILMSKQQGNSSVCMVEKIDCNQKRLLDIEREKKLKIK